MSVIKIKDESGDRDFFTIIPNYIANHSTANDQSLYFQMKRYAGEDGKCFATEQTLMRKMKIGKKAYNKSIDYLISKNWIDFIGLTNGKTRPIKTYKINNIWKLNNSYYEKISAESNVSFQKDKFQKEEDTSQKQHKISAESNVEEEPIKQEPLSRYSEQSSHRLSKFNPLGAEVIKSFESVDAKNKTYYGNKTQRAACDFLLDEYGLEEIIKIIKILPKINQKKLYVRQITSPYELKENWVKVGNALKQLSDNQRQVIL